MPQIFYSKCDKCDFKTSVNPVSFMYVKDESGNKIACNHPLEAESISEALKISKEDASAWLQGDYEKISEERKNKIENSVGMNYQYVCLDCFAENFLDKKTDEMKCKKCGSVNLGHVSDLIDKPCPKCKKGIITKVALGIS